MKQINYFITGILAGVILGLWMGVNMGKNRPMFANPFDQGTLGEIKEQGEKMLYKGGEKLEEAGKALQDKTKEKP